MRSDPMGDGRPQAEEPDFRLLFQAVPGLYLILLPDSPRFTIVAASDAYLNATLTAREGRHSILGLGLFEAFPDPPDDPAATGVRNLRASLERALASGAPDVMPVQHYDIRRQDRTWEERHWAPRNLPVRGPGGRICCLLHEVVDVTKVVQAQAAERAARAAVSTAEAALEAAKAELRQERALLHDVQSDSERLRAQTETLRAELRRLLEHSEALRDLSREQRTRRSGPQGKA